MFYVRYLFGYGLISVENQFKANLIIFFLQQKVLIGPLKRGLNSVSMIVNFQGLTATLRYRRK